VFQPGLFCASSEIKKTSCLGELVFIMPIILSYIQTRPLLEARKQGASVVETSPDLGKSLCQATLNADGVYFPGGECVSWADLEKISQSEVNCYLLNEQGIEAIQTFSEATNRVCSLLPTRGAPSMLLAGFVMHRIKDIDPWQHAQGMLAPLAPLKGAILDTATGLGYTAILAARTAESVTTIELDPAVQEIARLNPWSQELFSNPNITQVMGDAADVVSTFADGSFNRILHDPPTFKLAGQLYSGAFYRELYRVLKRGGRLFHYIGDPEGKTGGSITRGVMRRLHEAGFSRVMRRVEAHGVVAYK
jgi:predicted methyltransferase